MCVAYGDAIPVGSIDADVVLPYDHVAEGRPASALESREEHVSKSLFSVEFTLPAIARSSYFRNHFSWQYHSHVREPSIVEAIHHELVGLHNPPASSNRKRHR
jgi:hypothetical protein